MKMRPTSRYMRTLSNDKLAEFLPTRRKGPDGNEKHVAVSIFSKEAQVEYSRRQAKKAKKDEKLKKAAAAAAGAIAA